MSEVRLTEAERDELALACDAGCGFGDAWVRGIRSGLEDMLLPSVEAILAARLAPFVKLAEYYDYPDDRIYNEDVAANIREALTAPPEATAPTSGEVGV